MWSNELLIVISPQSHQNQHQQEELPELKRGDQQQGIIKISINKFVKSSLATNGTNGQRISGSDWQIQRELDVRINGRHILPLLSVGWLLADERVVGRSKVASPVEINKLRSETLSITSKEFSLLDITELTKNSSMGFNN